MRHNMAEVERRKRLVMGPQTVVGSQTAAGETPTAVRAKIGGKQLIVLLLMTHPPLNLIWGAIPTAYQFGGVVATPLALGIAGLALLAFSVGYGGMARRIQHRGGLYAFVAHGLGPYAGVGSSAVAILSYTALLSSLMVVLGGAATGLIGSLFGVHVPVLSCVLAGTAAIMALGRLRLPGLVRVLLAVGVLQVALVIWFDVTSARQPAGGSVSFEAVDPSWLLTGSLGLALGLAVSAFVGSETGASYVDDVAEPERTIPRATMISYAVTAVVLVISAWAISVAVGPENVVTAAQGQLESQTAGASQPFALTVIIQLVGARHAQLVAELFAAALVLGCLASGTTHANAVARQLTALAGDGVLPAARKPRRDGRPPVAAGLLAPLVAGAVALVVASTNPSIGILYLVIISGLGIAGVLTLSSLATIAWFLRSDDAEAGFFGWEGQVVAAGFAMVTTGFVFVYGLYRLPSVVPSGDAYGWTLWAAPLVAFGVGAAVLLARRTAEPGVLTRVGRTPSLIEEVR